MIIDEDLRAVADLASKTPNDMRALLRLVAKSGNAAMQSQMLFHVSETLAEKLTACNDPQVSLEELTAALEETLARETPYEATAKEAEVHLDAEDVPPPKRLKVTSDGGSDARKMTQFLTKPTKLKNTFAKFYDKYGTDEVTRDAFSHFMRTESGVINHTSANKLFRPPCGARVALFVRKGNIVQLAKEWVDAWQACGTPAATPVLATTVHTDFSDDDSS